MMYMHARADAPAPAPEPERRCPVLHAPDGSVTLRGHSQVAAAARDAETFSSAVSRFLQLPNGLDGAEHAAWRGLVEQFLTDGRVHELTPAVRAIARMLVANSPRDGTPVELVSEIGAVFAVRAQLAWLGWNAALEPQLLAWMDEHHAAVTDRNEPRIGAAAQQFDAMVAGEVAARRECMHRFGPDDVTVQLAACTQPGTDAPLTDAQIVSILRNWTAGDLGSLAASFGVIMHAIASDAAIQSHMRTAVAADDEAELNLAIDELLRRDDPFLANRRVTTTDTGYGPAGTRITLSWPDANMDTAAFEDPEAFRPHEHADRNLVWGTGPHVCPGRALATMELRELTRACLIATDTITLAPDHPPTRTRAGSVGGWHTVHARLA